jgi:hypothetical protein
MAVASKASSDGKTVFTLDGIVDGTDSPEKGAGAPLLTAASARTPRANLDDAAEATSFQRARLSVGKLCLSVTQEDAVCVEKGSIYGSALVMPQIARSAGYPPRMVIICVRGYFFLAVNCFLQWMLVYSLMKEEQVMNKFSGQMWMCNFGAQKSGCPEADGCIGPGGTRITPDRMYSFTQWNTRNFMKAALMNVFPDKADMIDEKVDPGEYGLESMSCRFLCTFLFIVAVTQELRSSVALLRLLWCVPSRSDCWVGDPDDEVMTLRVCGMPRHWKVINFFVVVFPKFMLWQFIARTGMIFLIETASIQNTIVNSTALTFILNIDELLFDVFSTAQTKHMLEILQGYCVEHPELDESTDDSKLSAEEAAAREEAILDKSGMDRYFGKSSIPWLLFVSLMVWFYFIWVYYSTHCFQSEDGTYVSRPMHLPKSTQFSHLSAFLPQIFPIPSYSTPYWTYSYSGHDES